MLYLTDSLLTPHVFVLNTPPTHTHGVMLDVQHTHHQPHTPTHTNRQRRLAERKMERKIERERNRRKEFVNRWVG